MPAEETWEGGCLCGAVRYRLGSTPFDCGYCHCRLCQAASGAPVLAFATVPLADFEVSGGKPRRFRSSDFGERWFCGDCGTQLCMRGDHQPDTIDVTIGSLDRPERVPPEFHILCRSSVPWFETSDSTTHNNQFRPDTRGLV